MQKSRFGRSILLACALAAAASAMVACGDKDVSFDTLETARSTGKSNAEYNAQKFRAEATQFSNFAIESQVDSTQSPKCPQGDGWASVKLRSKDNPAQAVGLKCSTVSGTVGCMTDADFQKKSFAADDGQCQPTDKVPFPLPKVAK